MIRALIIEDEPLARRELMRLLEDSSEQVEIVGTADSVESAKTLLLKHSDVDLAFFDIQLSDGLSFELFESIPTQIPIIFTTAFDEYAIRAFRVNSVDYLLKPIDPKMLEAALKKFKELHSSAPEYTQLLAALQRDSQPKYKTRWAVRVGDKIKRYEESEVAYFYADDDSLYLVPFDGPAVIADGHLSEMAELVNPATFFRVSRKFLVQYKAIERIERYGASQYSLELTPHMPERVLVSRSRTKEFLAWLDQ